MVKSRDYIVIPIVMQEAKYKSLKDKIVRCLVCQRNCVILLGKTGFCGTKLNRNGVLYTLNYGLLNGPAQPDPIEKKPLYHFLPGTRSLSIGSFGCNFRCKQCLNWWCAWGEPAGSILKKAAFNSESGERVKPQEIVSLCLKFKLPSISFTYNEPTLWAEFVLDTAKLAKKSGIKTVFVTNGSWTKETLNAIGPYIDAANIDFKGFGERPYRLMGAFWGKIPQMAVYARKKYGIHLEITTLLIPGVTDDFSELEKMFEWIIKNLRAKTPLHFSRYSPQPQDEEFAKIPATPLTTLKKAAVAARRAGLKFVYVWVPGAEFENGVYSEGDTICPKCKNLAIRRSGWEPEILGVDEEGRCKKCGEDLCVKLT